MMDEHWELVYSIAADLKRSHTDKSELKKVIAYLRWRMGRRDGDAIDLFGYLRVLTADGDRRSQSTSGHYRNIQLVCEKYLEAVQGETAIVIQILGWVARQM